MIANYILAGGPVLSPPSHTGYTLGITGQGLGTYFYALACKEVQREVSSHCDGTHTLWRWEYSLYMYRACKQGL